MGFSSFSAFMEAIGSTVGSAAVGAGINTLMAPKMPNLTIPPPPGAAMIDPAGSAAAAATRRRQAAAGGLASTIGAGALAAGPGVGSPYGLTSAGPTSGAKALLGG